MSVGTKYTATSQESRGITVAAGEISIKNSSKRKRKHTSSHKSQYMEGKRAE
jgi:hypothetical protein